MRRRPSFAARALAIACAVVCALALTLVPRDARANKDPALKWYTIVTPHFRVTYHSGVEEVAQHVASIAEGIHDTMTKYLGYDPKEPTEILLTDFNEGANGSASALPYNQLDLIVTAPEDMSPLGDVDDWYLELVTHEFTHVLHTDNIHGIPAIVNAVLGKTLAPNQVQPRWILEGLAVHEESARTSAGRIRNSMWDMWLRADVLEGNVAGIDEVSNTVRRWPQGNLYYLYGSYFTSWIAKTYGEDALKRAARDYGGQLVPWGFNRSIRRATGETYVEMYPKWIAYLKQSYGAQAAEVRAKGIREGVRITHHGQSARYPVWIPKGAWPEHQGGILYFREDEHLRAGLWALDVTRDEHGAVVKSDERRSEHVARTNGESYSSFLPDGSVVFSSQDIYKSFYLRGDIEKMGPGKKSSFGGPDGGRERLTPLGYRADAPATSPDGRHVVYTHNDAGTRSIQIADLTPSEGIVNARPLVPTAFMEQAFTPRWSPDGSRVAYSVWKYGGLRDIRVVDVTTGTYEDVTRDRAVDGAPSWSPDGKWLFFHSDRTGIMNIYAWEVGTRRFFQVTNVVNGAYEAAPSPDGKTLVYVGYTHEGYDLFAMPLDPSTWTEAPPYVDEHPAEPIIHDRRWTVSPYNPWPTLLPRKYGVQITQGAFGTAVIMNAAGSDIAGIHAVAASIDTEIEKPELQGSLSYSYGRLPFDAVFALSRSIAPRTGFQLGSGYKPTIIQETTAVSSSVLVPLPRAFDTSAVSITHSLARVAADLPIPVSKLDPYETPSFPQRGVASSLQLVYSFTDAERYVWGVGAERGETIGLTFDFTHPDLGSDFSGFAFNGDAYKYFLMPWLRHHSLALHVGGGTSGGTLPGRGAFFIGSFVDLPLVDTLENQLIQGGITLRGYPAVAEAGRNYLLTNAEYRFPIWNCDCGPSTLPVFFNRVNGAFFFDYGSAFDTADAAQWKSGVGGELWFDTTLGYVASFTFRAGYAKGLASTGIDKFYFVAAIPY